MFNMFKSEKTVIAELQTILAMPEYFYIDKFERMFKLKTSDILYDLMNIQIEEEKPFIEFIFTSIFDNINKNIKIERNNNVSQFTASKFYYKNIQDGNLKLWNNEFYIKAEKTPELITNEITYLIVNTFIKKYNILSSVGVKNIINSIEKRSVKNIQKKYTYSENKYINFFYENTFNLTIEKISKISKIIGFEIKINEKYKIFNNKQTFKENLENKIINFKEFSKKLRNHDVLINNVEPPQLIKLGWDIDFNSLSPDGVYLKKDNIPEKVSILLNTENNNFKINFIYDNDNDKDENKTQDFNYILKKIQNY